MTIESHPGRSAIAQPRARIGFGLQVALGLLAGLAAGFAARAIGPLADGGANGLAQALAVIGSSFVQLLKVLVPPLVLAALVAGVGRLRELHNAARLAVQTVLWFAVTALIAVSIGIILGLVLQPGAHSTVPASAAAAPRAVGSWLDFVKGLVPGNFLGLVASSKADGKSVTTGLEFNILQIVVIGLAVGLAALRSGEAGEKLLHGAEVLLAVLRRLLSWVIALAPVGTAGLIGNAVVRYGWDALASVGQFALAIYIALGLVLFAVYPLLLRWHGLSPVQFFTKAWPAIELAFVSRSSVATLPLSEAVAEQRLGIPGSYAAFAVPVGATTKMDGCAAVYPAISAIFVAQFYGLALGPGDYLLIAAVAVLGSAATAGVTGALVMLTLTLSTLGLPLDGVGLLLAIDPILDMGRTAVNVAGQIVVPLIVARREEILDLDRFNAPASTQGLAIP